MTLLFLEFCLIILGLYLVTQIFLPALWPSGFSYNWFFKWIFKKEKPVDDQILDLKHKKTRLEGEVDEVKEELVDMLEKHKQAVKDIKKL